MDVLDSVVAPSSSSTTTSTHQLQSQKRGSAVAGGAGAGGGVIEPPLLTDTHPFCYLQLKSSVLANREDTSSVDWNHLWIGQRFAHATEPPGQYLLTTFGLLPFSLFLFSLTPLAYSLLAFPFLA